MYSSDGAGAAAVYCGGPQVVTKRRENMSTCASLRPVASFHVILPRPGRTWPLFLNIPIYLILFL